MTFHISMAAMMLSTLVAGTAAAQSARSSPPAERLTQLLKDRKMAHAAAADPGESGRYVAAALIGGNQLLLVSARYAQPALLNERLYRGDHEGAYVELNAASVRESKLFVQDLGEPGLSPTRSQAGAFDIVYESGGKGTAFDGNWKAQGLSKGDYRAAFDVADGKYTHALETLLQSLAPGDGAGRTAQKQ